MQSKLKDLFSKKSKGQEEHFSAFILVMFGMVLTILIIIVILNQRVNTSAALAEYSMVSSVKEITYKFVSCFSADRFGLIDSDKFNQAATIMADCFKGEKMIMTFEIKNLDTGKRWSYSYASSEVSPPVSYQPSSYRLFLPIKYGDDISNGVLNVQIVLSAY